MEPTGSVSRGRRGRSSPRTWARSLGAWRSGISSQSMGRGMGWRSWKVRRPRRWKRLRMRGARSGRRARGWGARKLASAPSATCSRRCSRRAAICAAVALNESPPWLCQPMRASSSCRRCIAASWGGPKRRLVPLSSTRASPMRSSIPWGVQCCRKSPKKAWASHQVWGWASSTRSWGRRRRARSRGSPVARPSARARRLANQSTGLRGLSGFKKARGRSRRPASRAQASWNGSSGTHIASTDTSRGY